MKLFKEIWSDRMFIGLVALIAIGMSLIYFGKGSAAPTQGILTTSAQTTPVPASTTKIGALERELESKLQANLLQMDGAGKVHVSVSFSTGLKAEYARNENITKRTSKETDKVGGTRETTEVTQNNQVVMPSSSSQPVMVMEDRPEVAGVLIIAEGARDAKVREGIHTAVQTLLSIPGSKITVVPMGGS
ncbi:MAG: stage III sporulation protein AH [Desulfosporosinus sp. BRH_c37]|nr:MAG: stage III sporulation protein AH [Desulfosporosinus sp. BRH_c37]